MRKFFILAVLVVSVLTWFSIWVIKSQGMDPEDWAQFSIANVDMDEQGIPTIEASDWTSIIKAQGFVVASERLWQMEMMRRSAEGSLSEWFGEKTVEMDRAKLAENWQEVAEKAAAFMEEPERQLCQAYADGVNLFITQKENSWGLEYTLTRVKPRPWTCRDSFLILLKMAEQLSRSAENEFNTAVWESHLPPMWQEIIFPRYHPWSKPIFGKANPLPKPLKTSSYLPKSSLPQSLPSLYRPEFMPGSNAWVWTRKDQGTFLANDPHLNHSVPQLWYANRLRLSPQKWVAGVSLPGVPGIILGMNQSFAWGFTNQPSDIDDYLEEEVNHDQTAYVSESIGGKKIWHPILKKKFPLKIKGNRTEAVTTPFTERGPLLQKKIEGQTRYFSRRWLPLVPGMLRLPIFKLNFATNWDEFSQALDDFLVPPQAVVYADREGAIGMRRTGVSIKRIQVQKPRYIPKYFENNWQDVLNAPKEHRLYLKKDERAQYMVHANAQLWEDPYGERWASDDRQRRIHELLEGQGSFTLTEMERMQLDTHSLYHKSILDWILKHQTDAPIPHPFQKSWSKWDGRAESAPAIFTQALWVDQYITNLLLNQIHGNFLQSVEDLPPYHHLQRRAFILNVLERIGGFEAFGLSTSEVISEIIEQLEKNQTLFQEGYSQKNRWQTQHPFVRAIPIVGKLFRVRELSQTGFSDLVKVETPSRGASFRVVYDLIHPKQSRWSFPVGQSGHLRSSFFRSWQNLWEKNERVPILSGDYNWN